MNLDVKKASDQARLAITSLRCGDLKTAREALREAADALEEVGCQVCGVEEAPYTVCRAHFWKAVGAEKPGDT